MRRSRVIRVQFDLALPCDATREQVLEWLSFELHHSGSCSGDNPLVNWDPEALSEPVLTDSKQHLHEHVEETAEGHYRTTRWMAAAPYEGLPSDEQRRQMWAARNAKTT